MKGTLTSRPIMTVGQMAGDELQIFPLHYITITDEEGNSRSVFANYTFSENGPISDMKYRQLAAIGTKTLSGFFNLKHCKTPEEVEEEIRGVLEIAPHHSKLLFCYDRALGDDTPWFNIIGTNMDPVTLAELGLEVAEPFIEVPDHGELRGEEVQKGRQNREVTPQKKEAGHEQLGVQAMREMLQKLLHHAIDPRLRDVGGAGAL